MQIIIFVCFFQFLIVLVIVFILLMTTAILAAIFQEDVSKYFCYIFGTLNLKISS